MTYDTNTLFVIFDMVLAVAAFFTVLNLVQGYKNSSVGVVLVYFLTFVFLLGSVRFLFLLEAMGALTIDDMTDMLIWHLLFYLSVVAFSIAVRSLLNLISPGHSAPSMRGAIWFGVFSAVYAGCVILVAPVVNEPWVAVFEGSWADHSGVFHLVALTFAWYMAVNIWRLKQKYGSSFASLATPLIITIVMLGGVHLWELLNESWKVIVVSGDIGSIGESALWIPALFAVFFAFARFKRLTSSA